MSKFHREMMANISNKALGNSDRGLKELASDLIAQHGDRAARKIADSAYLNVATVERVLKCEPHYQPRLDTIERILRACDVRLESGYVATKGKYMPQPKDN